MLGLKNHFVMTHAFLCMALMFIRMHNIQLSIKMCLLYI